ncbi:MAG TPA: DUF2089 domain-containing protein [Caulobacteraceae bacterium]|nr:DUF2089 domain-containing protein [Caulobacteraceae bacterium]
MTQLTQGQALVVERVRLVDKDIAIEGRFALPELARLSAEDQVFVAAFVRAHGSIKEMEQVFGVSYPTIKARLNRLSASLSFLDTTPPDVTPPGAAPGAASDALRSEVLGRLERGEITADEAVRELEALP